jgi:putative phosphoesterase
MAPYIAECHTALVPQKQVSTKATLRARSDGKFRFAVVADTHGKPHLATEQRVRELAPDAILHAGDIGELTVLDRLAELAPVFAVRGNIDAPSGRVPDVVTLELMDGESMKLRLLLVHIAVYGPKLRAPIARLASQERASLVVCGHSHVPFIGRDRGVTLFNPGSIGPRRFRLPIMLGAIDVSRDQATLTHIDCETGKTWLPP